jgi:hypothetical protein
MNLAFKGRIPLGFFRAIENDPRMPDPPITFPPEGYKESDVAQMLHPSSNDCQETLL